MQDYRNLLLGTSRWTVHGKCDQGSKYLLDDGCQDITVLAESRIAERRVKSQLATVRKHVKDRAHWNAWIILSATTVPAPTSWMLLVVRRALVLSSGSGHLFRKSFEMRVLSILAS